VTLVCCAWALTASGRVNITVAAGTSKHRSVRMK
jgi:hypothetical protein